MTFYEWMREQVHRKDEIGEVAREMATDELDYLSDIGIGYWKETARIGRNAALYAAIGEYVSIHAPKVGSDILAGVQ